MIMLFSWIKLLRGSSMCDRWGWVHVGIVPVGSTSSSEFQSRIRNVVRECRWRPNSNRLQFLFHPQLSQPLNISSTIFTVSYFITSFCSSYVLYWLTGFATPVSTRWGLCNCMWILAECFIFLTCLGKVASKRIAKYHLRLIILQRHRLSLEIRRPVAGKAHSG